METYRFGLFEYQLNSWLFKNVKNSSEIHQDLIKSSKPNINHDNHLEDKQNLDWCFINSQMIVSRQHFLTSVYQTLISNSNLKLKTKSLNSEILFNLSPSTNIMESIKKFGINSKTSNILILKLTPINNKQEEEEEQQQPKVNLKEFDLNFRINQIVKGELINLNQLNQLKSISDLKLICSIYKIDQFNHLFLNLNLDDKHQPEEKKEEKEKEKEQEVEEVIFVERFINLIDPLIVSTIATKSVST